MNRNYGIKIYSLAIILVGGRTQEILTERGADFSQTAKGFALKTREEKIVLQDIKKGKFQGLLGLVNCEITGSRNIHPQGYPKEAIEKCIQSELGMASVDLTFCGHAYEMLTGEDSYEISRYFIYLNRLKRHSSHFSSNNFHVLDVSGLPVYELLNPRAHKIQPTHLTIIDKLKPFGREKKSVQLKIELRKDKNRFKIINVS